MLCCLQPQASQLWDAGFVISYGWYEMAQLQFSFSSARSRSALGVSATQLEETVNMLG